MLSRYLRFLYLLLVLGEAKTVKADEREVDFPFSRTVDADEFDDRTLLDTFGEAAKHFLTQKVIPGTDAQCCWDWRSVRCEPFCECAFRPKIGDYHIGRSCRAERKVGCDPIESVPEANALQVIIQRMVRASTMALDTAEHAVKESYRMVQTRVCEGMQEVQCTENGSPEIAWQERLFCQHKIPRCKRRNNQSSTSGLNTENDSPVSSDESMVRLL
jgi:hypothetical protein